MKTLLFALTILATSMWGCDDAPNVVGSFPIPKDSSNGITEMNTFDVRDIYDGHPYFWIYFPFEEQLSIDTLKATNFLFTTTYYDTTGWGATHYSYAPRNKSYTWSYPIFQYYRNMENSGSPFGWAADRFSRTTNGMLELSDYGGFMKYRNFYSSFLSPERKLNTPLLTPSLVDADPPYLEYTDTSSRDLGSIGLNLKYWTSYSSGRYIAFDSAYAGKYARLGGNPYVFRGISKFSGQPDPPIWNLRVYMPEILRIQPVGRDISRIEHNKNEPLQLRWEGDKLNPNDSMLIIVTNYHRNSVSFSHGTKEYPRKTWYHPQANFLGVGFMPVDPESDEPHFWPWRNHLDNVSKGGVPTKWYRVIQEQRGINNYTIPPEVFANAIPGEYFDIRCYRWTNYINYVDCYWYIDQERRASWLIGKGAEGRRQVRVQAKIVSQSIGRVQITE